MEENEFIKRCIIEINKGIDLANESIGYKFAENIYSLEVVKTYKEAEDI